MPFTATWMDLEIVTLSEVRERQKPYDITYMWNLKYDTNNLIYETESQTQRTDVAAKREGKWRRDGLGVWDQQMQIIIYRTDEQQGPTVQHRELYSISCDKPSWERMYLYV